MTALTAPSPDDPGNRPDDRPDDGFDESGPGAPGHPAAGTAAGRIPRPVRPADEGMATAEYAVATLAAVGFAGLLLTVLRSGEVQEMLLELVQRALAVAG
jgi:hypothetical protein